MVVAGGKANAQFVTLTKIRKQANKRDYFNFTFEARRRRRLLLGITPDSVNSRRISFVIANLFEHVRFLVNPL